MGTQFSSVAQSCLTLCDPTDCSTPGFPVHCQLPELTQTHVHWVGDAWVYALHLFMAALGLHCCVWTFSSGGWWGLLSGCGVRASHHSGLSPCGAWALGARASVVVVLELSCSTVYEIFLDQGSNPCCLYWKVILNYWTTGKSVCILFMLKVLGRGVD